MGFLNKVQASLEKFGVYTDEGRPPFDWVLDEERPTFKTEKEGLEYLKKLPQQESKHLTIFEIKKEKESKKVVREPSPNSGEAPF